MIVDSGDFDPFEFNYLYRRIRNRSSFRVLSIFAVIIVVLILVTIVEGTLGSASDFQLDEDVLRIAGVSGLPPSAPDFPLIRDVGSWLLLFTVVLGGVALHQQWRFMASCVSGLTGNGALIAKRDRAQLLAGRSLTTKLLGLNRILESCEPEDALPTLMNRIMKPLRKIRILWTVSVAVLAAALAALLIQGEKHGLFQTFAPRGLTAAEQQAWLDAAYRSWWASEAHIGGYIAYGILAFIALFIIVSFHSVGLIAVYLVTSLRFVAQPSADWLNRDGRYGWTPIALVYRTVLLGVALLSLALTVTLSVLGLNNFRWISVLLGLYCITVPAFVIVPRLAFRKAEETARQERIEDIVTAIRARGLQLDRDFEQLGPFLAEVDRCHQAKIRPFRLRRVSFSTLAFVYILPIALGLAQIIFPLSFGSQ